IYENKKYPIELKIRYNEKYVTNGLDQTARYLDQLGCEEGWLVIFDRRPEMKWDDKIYKKTESVNGKIITIIGI
ncbi:MAG: hypothetical protein LBP87_04225, partial [Planctomycetaceae bacterium]|nr:hypothetical protein [Planctomycetaceae bacterium]